MPLSDHSLQQLDVAYLERLDEASLRGISARLLADLKEARERLQQGAAQQLATAEQPLAVGARGDG